MDIRGLKEELSVIAGEYIKVRGFVLIDLNCRYEGRDLFMRILLDRPEGGITLGECANLNFGLKSIIEEKGIFKEDYTLEVSSPGLDRPLRVRSDFLRCIDKQASFWLFEPINGKIEFSGRITAVRQDSVSVAIDQHGPEAIVEIPIPKIVKAKQIIRNII
ncbi:MAG: hypothetical protein WC510_02490 [Candidatus Omnitrophota bacterium]